MKSIRTLRGHLSWVKVSATSLRYVMCVCVSLPTSLAYTYTYAHTFTVDYTYMYTHSVLAHAGNASDTERRIWSSLTRLISLAPPSTPPRASGICRRSCPRARSSLRTKWCAKFTSVYSDRYMYRHTYRYRYRQNKTSMPLTCLQLARIRLSGDKMIISIATGIIVWSSLSFQNVTPLAVVRMPPAPLLHH
jgi:hypothetical protein